MLQNTGNQYFGVLFRLPVIILMVVFINSVKLCININYYLLYLFISCSLWLTYGGQEC